MYKGLKEAEDLTVSEGLSFWEGEVTVSWLEVMLGKALREARQDPLEYLFGALCNQLGLPRGRIAELIGLVDQWKKEKLERDRGTGC